MSLSAHTGASGGYAVCSEATRKHYGEARAAGSLMTSTLLDAHQSNEVLIRYSPRKSRLGADTLHMLARLQSGQLFGTEENLPTCFSISFFAFMKCVLFEALFEGSGGKTISRAFKKGQKIGATWRYTEHII